MEKHNILLVDDEEENLLSTKALVQRWGYVVDAVQSGEEAIEYVKSELKDYAAVLLDYRMPGKSGTDTAKEIRTLNEEITLLVYSAYPSVESLTATIRAGALNFIDKNEDMGSLKAALESACKEYEKVRKVKPPLSQDEASKLISSMGMVGRSGKFANVCNQILKCRKSKKPALVLGETGVGKELVARALHVGHKDQYFVINCASLSSTLVESELFGHEKGAFTGAINRKVGILEAAKGGTVYLDELHHLDLKTQAKLLRVIREMKIRRLGGTKEEDVDFRLVASSWPNLEERVAEGSFLPDLYFRLKFLTIEIPPLRERPEDIEPLVNHFCEKHFKETGERKHVLVRALRHLEKFSWPGNVGDLDGSLSMVFSTCDKDTIDETDLEPRTLGGHSAPLGSTFAEIEARQKKEKRAAIENALRACHSVRGAARRLGLKPSSLHSLMTRMGIRAEEKVD